MRCGHSNLLMMPHWLLQLPDESADLDRGRRSSWGYLCSGSYLGSPGFAQAFLKRVSIPTKELRFDIPLSKCMPMVLLRRHLLQDQMRIFTSEELIEIDWSKRSFIQSGMTRQSPP